MRAVGLHGRRSELELIRAAAHSASAGTAQLVTLVGVAGVGKSALIEAASDDLAAGGFRVDRVALSEALNPPHQNSATRQSVTLHCANAA